MSPPKKKTVYYRQSRFSTRLPVDRLYTPSHCWLTKVALSEGAVSEDVASEGVEADDVWRVGLTKFATRMLGDLVEQEFSVAKDDLVEVGRSIGWIEGFKALSDIYCVLEGSFVGGNPELAKNPALLDSDPYGAGWLYSVRGTPDARSVDVEGYVAVLDATIERMLHASLPNEGDESCPKPGT